MQNKILEKAGINPKTLLSNYLYWQKLNSNIATVLSLPIVILFGGTILVEHIAVLQRFGFLESALAFMTMAALVAGALFGSWLIYVLPKLYASQVRQFAQKNNLTLLPSIDLIALLPDTWQLPDAHNQQALGFALPVASQNVTVFDYACVLGSGRDKRYLNCSFAVLRLKGNYPHLFLDSKKNGKNHQYAASQKVELEGGFSKYFDLYMPEGSQAASLSVFAPDMMQTVLDTGRLFDIEVKGNQAVIIAHERAFTRRTLPALLTCAAGLSKEFKQLDSTWQPVFAAGNRAFSLKSQPGWRLLLASMTPFLIALLFNLLPANIRNTTLHSSPSSVTPATNPAYANSPEVIDENTYNSAYRIAYKLNGYMLRHTVPGTLADANIGDVPPTISYAKLTPDIYQFCATYHLYVNGNGQTGASGNIRAYYGMTVDSPNLPPTLQIVEWHDIGKNCQVVKPRPAS